MSRSKYLTKAQIVSSINNDQLPITIYQLLTHVSGVVFLSKNLIYNRLMAI
jgi:CubicO group peptidase (beta-lactamase class C family)